MKNRGQPYLFVFKTSIVLALLFGGSLAVSFFSEKASTVFLIFSFVFALLLGFFLIWLRDLNRKELRNHRSWIAYCVPSWLGLYNKGAHMGVFLDFLRNGLGPIKPSEHTLSLAEKIVLATCMKDRRYVTSEEFVHTLFNGKLESVVEALDALDERVFVVRHRFGTTYEVKPELFERFAHEYMKPIPEGFNISNLESFGLKEGKSSSS